MKKESRYNPGCFHIWLRYTELLSLASEMKRMNNFEATAILYTIERFLGDDEDIENAVDAGDEVLVELDIDPDKHQIHISTVTVAPEFVGRERFKVELDYLREVGKCE